MSATSFGPVGPTVIDLGSALLIRDLPPLDPDHPSVPEGIELQGELSLRRAERVLADHGAGLADILALRLFLTEPRRDWPRMERVLARLFAGAPPPTSILGVSYITRDCRIDIEVIVRIPGSP